MNAESNVIDQERLKPMKEQIIYANLLQLGAWLGIFLLLATYTIYCLGVLKPQVEKADVVKNWTNPAILVTKANGHEVHAGDEIHGEIEAFQVCGTDVECADDDSRVITGVSAFSKITGSPVGWGWLKMLGTGDYLNFIGLTLLAVLTIICYLILIPGYLKRKDMAYALICITEVVVLCVAASGILGSGGH